jgi:Glycosyl hydrolase family 3 C-terminal domain
LAFDHSFANTVFPGLNVGQIDTALERRYTQAFKAGIFERKLVQTPIDFAAGGQKAREIGSRSTVLLKNSGALPLRSDLRTLVLIGKASQVFAQQAVAGGAVVGEAMGGGGGSYDVVPNYTVSPIEGLRRALTELGNTKASIKLILVDDENVTAAIDGKQASKLCRCHCRSRRGRCGGDDGRHDFRRGGRPRHLHRCQRATRSVPKIIQHCKHSRQPICCVVSISGGSAI